MHPLATRLHPQHCLWGKEPLSPHLNVTDEAPSSTHWPMGGKNEMEEGGKKHSDFLRWQLSLLRIWPRPGPGSVPAPAAVWVCCPPLLTPFFFVSVSPSSLPPPQSQWQEGGRERGWPGERGSPGGRAEGSSGTGRHAAGRAHDSVPGHAARERGKTLQPQYFCYQLCNVRHIKLNGSPSKVQSSVCFFLSFCIFPPPHLSSLYAILSIQFTWVLNYFRISKFL